ncbi:hypothetical protein Leryth_010221, partial [Lithospermum erythrorhizon]
RTLLELGHEDFLTFGSALPSSSVTVRNSLPERYNPKSCMISCIEASLRPEYFEVLSWRKERDTRILEYSWPICSTSSSLLPWMTYPRDIHKKMSSSFTSNI